MYVINSFLQLHRFCPRLCYYLFCFHSTLPSALELLEVITHLLQCKDGQTWQDFIRGASSLYYLTVSHQTGESSFKPQLTGTESALLEPVVLQRPSSFFSYMWFLEFMMSSRRWLSGRSFKSLVSFLKPAISQPRSRESKAVIPRPPPCPFTFRCSEQDDTSWGSNVCVSERARADTDQKWASAEKSGRKTNWLSAQYSREVLLEDWGRGSFWAHSEHIRVRRWNEGLIFLSYSPERFVLALKCSMF